MRNALDRNEMAAFEPEAKIGLIATVNPQGHPHMTLISSLRAKRPAQLMWGQFTEGLSKRHVKGNPKTGFLILTPDKRMWRGKAGWTHEARQGGDYELYNTLPMFRYNAYLGIHTVHYMDLAEVLGPETLPMVRIVIGSLLTRVAGMGASEEEEDRILKPWGQGLLNSLGALKFLAYVGGDGFPAIVPLIQCQAPTSRILLFSPLAYEDELSRLQEGAELAVFGLTMKMEDILVRGRFAGYGRSRLVRVGRIDIGWVYNSMPPKQGQIYPMEEIRPVVNF
jgi:hypothetical protein